MKESVSAIFSYKDELFFIKRQSYLKVFPGYFATPGGKVDETDSDLPSEELTNSIFPNHFRPQVLRALVREVSEELNFDLFAAIKDGIVDSIYDVGLAITPEFNPYRFKNYYFRINLTKKVEFDLDVNEAECGLWKSARAFLDMYYGGEMLAVPPAIMLLKEFYQNPNLNAPVNLSLPHNSETEVPMIESIYGVRQFLPLSNTFPPANRTNSFIIGDVGEDMFLVDPSPKDEMELEKFLRSVDKVGFNKILITHHHSDHYQFSREIAQKYHVPIYLSEDTFNRIGAAYFEGIDLFFLKEGDVITKSLGANVVVYEVPGHDRGQLALAPTTLSWFLVGDLIQTVGTVVIGAPEGDMGEYFTSLERVIKLRPRAVIPSHGIILGGVDKLLETLNHRKIREAQIIELLEKEKSIDEILEIVYVGLKEALLPYARKTILCHIEKINSDKKRNSLT